MSETPYFMQGAVLPAPIEPRGPSLWCRIFHRSAWRFKVESDSRHGSSPNVMVIVVCPRCVTTVQAMWLPLEKLPAIAARLQAWGLRIGDAQVGQVRFRLVRGEAPEAILWEQAANPRAQVTWSAYAPIAEYLIMPGREIAMVVDAPSLKEIVWIVNGVTLRATCRPEERHTRMFVPMPAGETP